MIDPHLPGAIFERSAPSASPTISDAPQKIAVSLDAQAEPRHIAGVSKEEEQ